MGFSQQEILEWFAILSSNGPYFIRSLHHDPFWGALHSVAHNFIELPKPLLHDKAVIHKGVPFLIRTLRRMRAHLNPI